MGTLKFYINTQLDGGRLQTFFIFYHPFWRKTPILTNMFQMGWNQQLVNFCEFSLEHLRVSTI